MSEQFTVTGMTCGHCEAAVKRAIMQLDPAAQVAIDRSSNSVTVSQSQQSREAIADVIREEGYEVAA